MCLIIKSSKIIIYSEIKCVSEDEKAESCSRYGGSKTKLSFLYIKVTSN